MIKRPKPFHRECLPERGGRGHRAGVLIVLLVLGALSGYSLAANQAGEAAVSREALASFRAAEYGRIQRHIDRAGSCRGMAKSRGINPYLLDKQAAVLPTDRDPLDVVLRRTRALLNRAKGKNVACDVDELEHRLNALDQQAHDAGLAKTRSTDRYALYNEVTEIRRSLLLSDPAVDFDEILFITFGQGGGYMAEALQTCHYGCLASPRDDGSLYILSGFKSGNPTVRDVLAQSTVTQGRLTGTKLSGAGAFHSPALSYDGTEVVFSWTEKAGEGGHDKWQTYFYNRGQCYHLFKVNIDGTNLVQLTDAPFDDYHSCWLPNGRILFVSNRRQSSVRCHGGGSTQACGTMYSIKPDGSDLIQLSYHETSELHPSVDNNGMVVYTRWDYIDREFHTAHHLWTCSIDGRDPRAPHGNYPRPYRAARPWAEYGIKALPNTATKYVCLASKHHPDDLWGVPVFIDLSVKDDGASSQISVLFDTGLDDGGYPCLPREKGARGCETDRWKEYVYFNPWPLSEDLFLMVNKQQSAIVLLDRFGNEEVLLQKDGVRYPIPVTARAEPPETPTQTWQGERAGHPDHKRATISVTNVYESDFEWPPNTRITALRIIQLVPKPWSCPGEDDPNIGFSMGGIPRLVLGTVPVEDDGSAYFEAPVEREIYFQALDERGIAVQSMRSGTYVHPGEHLSCLGCHEDKWKAVPPLKQTPLAMRRAPSPIEPDVDGSCPLSFGRLVVPVLKSTCKSCHDKQGTGPNFGHSPTSVIDANKKTNSGYKKSGALYLEFKGKVHYFDASGDGGAKWSDRTLPRSFGAYAPKPDANKKLFEHLRDNHEKGNLTDEEFHRMTLWMDCNALELSCYRTDAASLEAQRRGEVVWPRLDVDPDNPAGVERDRPLPHSVTLNRSKEPAAVPTAPDRFITRRGTMLTIANPRTRYKAFRVSVCDNLGRVLYSRTCSAHEAEVHVRLPAHSFADGMYHVRVAAAGEILTGKVVLVR